MKKIYLFCVAAIILTLMSLGYTTSSFSGQNTFLNEAARAGLTEVQMANLAIKKSADPAVKAFAQRLITDHTMSNQELTSLASKKEVTLPTEITNRGKADIDKLNKLSGAAFDAEFVRLMVQDHEIVIALYRRASAMNTDVDIKEFAAKTIPNLEAHLQTARSMNRVPANIKSNSNKIFRPSLGSDVSGMSPNTNRITITNTSNMPGHPNNPNTNAQRPMNTNANSNVNR